MCRRASTARSRSAETIPPRGNPRRWVDSKSKELEMSPCTLARRSGVFALALVCAGASGFALDHGDAPLVSRTPKLDGTDLFVFRSYEPGREDFVTLIACFQPFQDPFAGPDYFLMDPDARYQIHVDRTGDGVEDVSFRFRFTNALAQGVSAPSQPPVGQQLTSPLVNTAPISQMVDPPEAGIRETYTVDFVIHGPGGDTVVPLTQKNGGSKVFVKPLDNVGSRSFANYPSYAAAHVYDLAAPAHFGRVFVGQRKDPRAIAMGELFDLVGLNLVGPTSGRTSSLDGKSVTALCIEVPVSLLGAAKKVIGVWSTAELLSSRVLSQEPDFDELGTQAGRWQQVSRTGAPLVNSLLVGFRDKDRFNATAPAADSQYEAYFDFPAFPQVIQQQTGLTAPVSSPRSDVRDYFLRGVRGLTFNGSFGEMLRFRYADEPVPPAQQKSLGALDGDLAGYPNGRRPGDDVVDITLRILMGARLAPADAPSGGLPLTDGVALAATDFQAGFPYLLPPPGGN